MTDQRAIDGIGGLELPEEVRRAALEHLERWWTEDRFAAYRPQLEALVERGAFAELCDAFRCVLPFGTGGRRGRVGIGPNRINPWTVATSIQGHAAWLRARFPDVTPLRVVVAYDVRRFDDAGGIYDPSLPNPISGMSSRDLAELAARVYAANGIEVVLPRDPASYLSTPELSFCIRRLDAHGGVNMSASHNPPDDNGVKVYDRRGSQLVPPDDESLLDAVAEVADARLLSWADATSSGRVRWLSSLLHGQYIQTVADLAVAGARDVHILYTPLHGTGSVGEALVAAGFPCRVFAAQAEPDGRFPTVPGHVANPERPEAMALAVEAAAGCALVMGTDPDADRIGAEVHHDGGWVHLTGNDIGALIVDQALKRTYDGQPLVVTTEVTSSLIGRVARARGAVVIDDLLVGFKYVGEVLRALEEDGCWGDVRAEDVRFAAGLEESHGVLLTDAMRDKDAAGGAVVLACAAAAAQARGETLVDVLHHLQSLHGYVLNAQVSTFFEGAVGASRLSALLDGLRSSPPGELGGRAVERLVDHRNPAGRFGPYRSNSDRAARNVLVLQLASGPMDDGARLVLRPSGTEPKLKVYAEVLGRPRLDSVGRSAVEQSLGRLVEAVRTELSGGGA